MEHQRICQAYHQTSPPPNSQLNHPSSSIVNRQAPRNPIDPMMQSQPNQSAIHPPDVYSTQPPAAAVYHQSFQNGSSSSPSGSHLFSTDYYPPMGGDRGGQYPAHPGSFIDNYDYTLPGYRYHFNPGATHGSGTGDATRFNRGS